VGYRIKPTQLELCCGGVTRRGRFGRKPLNPHCILRSLLKRQDGNTPLHYAISTGIMRCVQKLVEFKANVNAVNDVRPLSLSLCVSGAVEVARPMRAISPRRREAREREREREGGWVVDSGGQRGPAFHTQPPMVLLHIS
jgi:hypothetical protein